MTILLAYLSSFSPAFCLGTGSHSEFHVRSSICSEKNGSTNRYSFVFFHCIHISTGRVIRQGQPYFIEGGMAALGLGSGAVTATMTRPTLTEYDGLDRVTRTTLSDGSAQSVLYDVTAGGEPYTRTSDPLGNMGVQRADPAGNIIYVERQDRAGKKLAWAGYEYDAMGQMLRATDAKGNSITAEYDLLGRKLSLASVDGGRREYKYDAYRLLEETSPNLRAKGRRIGYGYDGLGRLVRVDYPETADTVYTYGDPGASDNTAGRVTQVTDAGGTTRYKYGKLGEVTEEARTLSVKNAKVGDTMTATTGYLSNYLGQMERITYPDGETVEYGYDAGGQVERVTGRHYGHDHLFVLDIGYDELGQRSYIRYGNGVRTDYGYDADRRWLSSVETRRDGRQYQNIRYSFDLVGNVLGYTNDCMDGLRYATSQSYGYDDLYQLTSAHGETTSDPYKGGIPDYRSTYDQAYGFDVIGNMTRKTSGSSIYPQKVIGSYLDYDFDYGYAEGYAHRLDHAGGRYYRYDADGNITMEHHGPIPEGLPDGGISTGGGTAEGGDDGFWDDWDEDSEYSGSWTGNGSGSGSGAQGDNSVLAVYEWDEWDERDRMVRSQTPGVTAFYVYGEDGERTNKYTADAETLYFSRLWTWHGDRSIGDHVSKHIYLGETRIVSKLNSSGKNGSYGEERGKTYFYHPDHLGSAQLITDYKGDEYQRIEYTGNPVGLPMSFHCVKTQKTASIRENSAKPNSRKHGVAMQVDKMEDPLYVYMPYKFTGKELDAETGLYYYGARYLDPQTSVWLSTDPALGDYLPTAGADNSNLPGMGGVFNSVNMQLYHYAGNNPLKYIDPDGCIPIDTVWDIGCTIFDTGVAIYKSSKGDNSGWTDVGLDLASILIPYVPAGISKLKNAAQATHKITTGTEIVSKL